MARAATTITVEVVTVAIGTKKPKPTHSGWS
jgi:hypothetical protein